jgi:hypothetical protein
MSPEQLKTLQKLRKLFEDGLAGPAQIKQLSELLATINHMQVDETPAEYDIGINPTQLVS